MGDGAGLVPALQGWEGEGSARRRGGLPLDQGSVTSHPAALSPSLSLAPGRVWSRIRPCLPILACPSWASSETPPCATPSPATSQPRGWGVMGSHRQHGMGHNPLQPLIPGKGGWSPPCPHAPGAAPCPREANATLARPLQLPSPCHQRSRKKPSKNLPASAMQRLPFASAEVYWRSQHRALSVDGYMCAHL